MSLAFATLAAAPCVWSAAYGLWAERRWPAQGRFVPALGARAHIWEAGEGPPVVLLHGASGSVRDMAAPLAAHLAGLRLIAIDRPSHGHSGDVAGHARLAVQARFVAEALAAAGVEGPVTVAGHSWGAAVALRLAIDCPKTVKALIAIAPASHPFAGPVALHNRLGALPVLGPALAWTVPAILGPIALEAGLKSAFAPGPVPADYAERSGIPLYFRARTFAANARDMAAASAELALQAPQYPALTLPVAVISGGGDTVVSNAIHAKALARDLAHAETLRIEGAGHMPTWAAPQTVAGVIRRLAEA
jgi:pimeloyl-ACP methyl ester carboxylesterase